MVGAECFAYRADSSSAAAAEDASTSSESAEPKMARNAQDRTARVDSSAESSALQRLIVQPT